MVISSLVAHHLPTETKTAMFREIARVLKSGGRLLIADFGVPRNLLGRLIALTLKRHSFTRENLQGVVRELISKAGLRDVRVEAVQFGIIEHIHAQK